MDALYSAQISDTINRRTKRERHLSENRKRSFFGPYRTGTCFVYFTFEICHQLKFNSPVTNVIRSAALHLLHVTKTNLSATGSPICFRRKWWDPLPSVPVAPKYSRTSCSLSTGKNILVCRHETSLEMEEHAQSECAHKLQPWHKIPYHTSLVMIYDMELPIERQRWRMDEQRERKRKRKRKRDRTLSPPREVVPPPPPGPPPPWPLRRQNAIVLPTRLGRSRRGWGPSVHLEAFRPPSPNKKGNWNDSAVASRFHKWKSLDFSYLRRSQLWDSEYNTDRYFLVDISNLGWCWSSSS